jgi:hypothetical protein
MAFAHFNRRHKVVFFITLVLTGLSLVTGKGIGPSLGVALLGCSVGWALGSDTFSRFSSVIMGTKHKLDRKSKSLAIISGIILVALILFGLGCLIDYFDPGSVNSHSPLLLLAALIAVVLAFLVYRQLRVWGGMVKVKHP